MDNFYFGPVDLPDWDTSHRVLSELYEAMTLADDEPKSKSYEKICYFYHRYNDQVCKIRIFLE